MASPLADILMRAQASEGEGSALPEWLLSAAMHAAPESAEFPYQRGDFQRAGPQMRRVGIGESLGNIYEGMQNRDERGIPQGPGFGAALMAAPGADRVIAAAPRLATAGLAGYNLLAGTDAAGGAETSEAIKGLQTKLRDAGLYKGPIDGVMNKDGPTEKAKQVFDAAEQTRQTTELKNRELAIAEGANTATLETARANQATAEAKREADRIRGEKDAADLARKQAGDERMRDIEKNISPTSRIIRDYSGPIGLAGGALAGGLIRGALKLGSDALSKYRARAGDAIMATPTVGKTVADEALSRVARVNEFWRKGGGEVPFINTPAASPGFAVNPKAAQLKSTYNQNIHPVVEATTTAVPVGEFVWADMQGSEAQDELIKAQEAAAVDPSEVNLQRIQAAKDNVALYKGASNAGRVAASAIGLGAVGSRYMPANPKLQPKMAPAETEQLSLQKLLRENYDKAQKKAEKAAAAKKAPRVPAPQVGVPPAMTGAAATKARTLHNL